MFKNPIAITGVALLVAAAVNVYFYCTGVDLTYVVSRTLFVNMLIVLSLVPLSEAVRVKHADQPIEDTAQRIKTSMKTVALYVIGVAIITAILFNIFAEPLVAAKLNDISAQAQQFIDSGEITQEQASSRLKAMEKFYTVTVFLPVLILTNLFVGFVSSIPAALLIKK